MPSLHMSSPSAVGQALRCLLQAALVVYDEIHYLRDKERGVVWEESIVLMPKSVRFAFLSATIPNAMEFAEWIARTHRCLTFLSPHPDSPCASAQAVSACNPLALHHMCPLVKAESENQMLRASLRER